jgi:hypothetical protein
MIIGHDLMSQLRILLDFDKQIMMWDEFTLVGQKTLFASKPCGAPIFLCDFSINLLTNK